MRTSEVDPAAQESRTQARPNGGHQALNRDRLGGREGRQILSPKDSDSESQSKSCSNSASSSNRNFNGNGNSSDSNNSSAQEPCAAPRSSQFSRQRRSVPHCARWAQAFRRLSGQKLSTAERGQIETLFLRESPWYYYLLRKYTSQPDIGSLNWVVLVMFG